MGKYNATIPANVPNCHSTKSCCPSDRRVTRYKGYVTKPETRIAGSAAMIQLATRYGRESRANT
eukprot:scaffold4252_cov176-Amphora_coffeaeformis.AAC.2